LQSFHNDISLLDTAGFAEDNLHLQQSIDDNDNLDESSEKGLFTAPKREEMTISSASSSIAKIKQKPKQAKAPTKTPPVSEK